MAHLSDVVYRPNPAHRSTYDALYAEYRRLHDYFGRGENDVMKTLRRLRDEAIRGRSAVPVTSGAS
jgi:L-ribulokinase